MHKKDDIPLFICILVLLFCFTGISAREYTVMDAVASHNSLIPELLEEEDNAFLPDGCTLEKDETESVGEHALPIQHQTRTNQVNSRLQQKGLTISSFRKTCGLHLYRTGRRCAGGRHILVCSLRL